MAPGRADRSAGGYSARPVDRGCYLILTSQRERYKVLCWEKRAMSEFVVERQELCSGSGSGSREWRVEVPADLRYLEGHFDNDPIVPAIAQVECLARRLSCESWPDLARLMRVRQLKFRRPVRPGDVLGLRLERTRPNKVSFSLRRGEETCSSGVLEFEENPG